MFLIKKYILKERIKNVWNGSKELATKIIHSLRKFNIKRISIYVLDLSGNSAIEIIETACKIAKSLENKVQIKILSKEDRTYFDKYLNLRSDILNKQILENILNKGCRCFLAIKNEEILGVLCLVAREFPLFEFGLDFIFEENQSYLFHFYILPEYRNGRIAVFIEGQALEYCKKQGFKYVVAAAYEKSGSSNRNLKYGFDKIGSINFFERFIFKWHRLDKYEHSVSVRVKLNLLNKRIVEL